MTAEDNMNAHTIITPSVERLSKAATYADAVRSLYQPQSVRSCLYYAQLASDTFSLTTNETKAVAAMLKAIPHQPTEDTHKRFDEVMSMGRHHRI